MNSGNKVLFNWLGDWYISDIKDRDSDKEQPVVPGDISGSGGVLCPVGVTDWIYRSVYYWSSADITTSCSTHKQESTQ